MARFRATKNTIRIAIILVEPCITGENTACASAKLGKIFPRNKIFAIKPSGDNTAKLIKVIIEPAIINGKTKINASRIAAIWRCEFNLFATGTKTRSMPCSNFDIILILKPPYFE